MKILARIILFLCIYLSLYSQEETNNWYFGYYAGLRFCDTCSKPLAVNDGVLYSPEGCASISDSSGNLLFYTDGMTVYNKNHQVMKNGSDLLGNNKSTQSSLILPKPNNKNIYYLFTISRRDFYQGLNYSIVDISKDNGAGEVIEKNIRLFDSASDKITAVKHKNNLYYWIFAIEYGKDNNWPLPDSTSYLNKNFLSFLLTDTGVVSKPVISPIKTKIMIATKYNIDYGYLKTSPKGDKIAAIVFVNKVKEAKDNPTVLIYSIDNSTGICIEDYSLILCLNKKGTIYEDGFTFLSPYGCEFSKSGRKLYIGNTYSYNDYYSSYDSSWKIIQIDLSLKDRDKITKSKTVVWAGGRTKEGLEQNVWALQMGPDGKIYVAYNNSQYLGVINNPEAAGTACNYERNGIYLEDGKSFKGLPNFPSFYFSKNRECSNEYFDIDYFSNNNIKTIGKAFISDSALRLTSTEKNT
ncbi:MAG: hypothetical protein QG635_2096, partial [Bacteroidota bacterium]|nr:hypothetical protein [Bacteroidota bacterium]